MAQLLATGFDALNRYRKIEEATAPRDDPAPVYLLDEIADMARSSPEAATSIAEAVQKKLAAKHPITKFKALRIIKHLSQKGCSHFQRCMQRQSTCVRELIHWRGEPDPFKGDVPNARVREFAKEVAEVMFNTAPLQSNNNNTLAAQGKIQGFGSENSSGHYGGGAGGGSGGFSSSANSAGQYGGFSSSSASGGYGPPRSGSGIGGSIPTSFAEAQRAASQLTQVAQQALGDGPIAQGISNVLGGFLQPAGYSGRLNESSGYNDMSPEPSYSSGNAYAAPAVGQVSASQVLGSESALVDDITTPGGVRALPDPADLRRFVDTASSMDGLRIAEVLREKMESPRWQVTLRALAALQALLQRGSSQACGEVAVMFQSDPSPVRSALSSPQAQVQQLAAATLKLLTGEEVQVTAAPSAAAGGGGGGKKVSTAAAAAARAPVADLLIDDTPTEAATTTSASAAPASAAAASGIDLLGDLAGPPAPSATAAAAPAAAAAGGVDSLFDGLGVQAAPAASAAATPAAAAASGGGDMFGGLVVESASSEPAPSSVASGLAPAAAAAPAAAGAAGKQPAPLDELFAGLTTSPGVGAAAAGAGHSNGNSSLLSSLSQPQPLLNQQQQQFGAIMPAQQQQPQDWLGGDLGVPGPKMQQVPAPAYGQGGMMMQQQQQHQWSMGQIPAHAGPMGGGVGAVGAHTMGMGGVGGMGMGHMGLGGTPQQQQQHLVGGVGSLAGASGAAGSGSGLIKGGSFGLSGSGSGGNNNSTSSGGAAWSGHDDVSNLMRQVGHGGKYDPAFDFVADLMHDNPNK